MKSVNQKLKFRLPNELDNIPSNLFGVYVIKLHFPSDYELGLMPLSPNIGRVKAVIRRNVLRVSAALGTENMVGKMRIAGVARHLSRETKVVTERIDRQIVEELMDAYLSQLGANLDKIRQLTNLLRVAVESTPPLYIGMTSEQSFKTRITQHYNGETEVAQRISQLGLDWSMLSISCMPAPFAGAQETRQLEKIIQTLLKPTLSRQ